jgi:hypothetical protein
MFLSEGTCDWEQRFVDEMALPFPTLDGSQPDESDGNPNPGKALLPVILRSGSGVSSSDRQDFITH